MRHVVSTLPGAGGLDLFSQAWLPDTSPRAAIALIHGFGEHSDRYGALIEHFAPRGYAIYSFDLRGHGRSPGRRGHIISWDEYRRDLQALLDLVRREQPGIPVFLYGHSLGGLIVLEYALQHPDGLAGVIASAPAVGAIGYSAILLTIGRILSRLWPSFAVKTPSDPSELSRDPEDNAFVRADPLAHRRGSARLSTERDAAAARVHAGAVTFAAPLLMLHGTADRVTSPADSLRFFQAVPIADKHLLEYEGGRHELHNDINRTQVMSDVETWLEQHL